MHTFWIDGRVPSKKNSKRWIVRGQRKFLVPSAQHEEWLREKLFEVREKWGRDPLVGPVTIRATFYMPDRRATDLSNKFESIADLLVTAGVLLDDSWQVVQRVHLEGCLEKGKVGVSIIISD